MAPIGYLEILLAVLCFLFLRRLRNENAPMWNWPLLGMLPGFLVRVPRLHDEVTELLKQTGWTFLFKGPWFTCMDALGTSDPANVHYIMSSNFANFPKGAEFLRVFDILGDGIFNADADSWRNQRKFAQALMHHRGFQRFLVNTSREKVEKGMVPVLEHVSKQGLVVDLQDLFQRFTLDATCKLVTGNDPGSLTVELPEVPFSKAMDAAEKAIFFRHVVPESWWMFLRWLRVGEEKKMSKAWETIDHFVAEYISMKREELRKGSISNEEEGVDLLTSYLKQDETKGSDLFINDAFLRDTIVNFMLAGRDTTAAALTWFFWLVSKNPLVETKIRDELKSAIPAKEAEKWWLFDVEELSKLVYLHGALCEALRLYPPVPFQQKTPLQPDILPSGHHVRPKMQILFSMYTMGRMASLWGDDCLEFKPERWISERGAIKHEPSYKFMAFNAGPRTCLGKEVAFTQMKAVAATMLHNYKVEVVKGHPVVPDLSIILHMKHGLMVKVTKRWT